MQVKLNGQTSTSHDLTGGAPQWSILGQLLYIIGSDNAGEDVPSEDKFKYIYDLATLEALNIQNKLIHYKYLKHVPSDIPTKQRFLLADTFIHSILLMI